MGQVGDIVDPGVQQLVDTTNLGAVPETLLDCGNKRLYSWAYHKMELVARNAGFSPEACKLAARLKARQLTAGM